MLKKKKSKKIIRHESEHHGITQPTQSPREQILSKYDKELQEIINNSSLLSELTSRCVPQFGANEIEFGPVLGVGGFCAVREVKSITLDPSLSHLQPSFQVRDTEFHETETRKYMATHCMRDTSARYAIKKLKQEFKEEKYRYRGMLDLAIEAEYLSHLTHPNIIKMRGSLVCDSRVKEPIFFIVIDRLSETLQEKIDITWPKEYKGMLGPFGGLGKDKRKIRAFFLERMIVVHDLSAVFRYLHSNGIIYRDLKPENIGFDIRGDLKLFDFGLCKEIPQFAKHKPNNLYKLTVKTGSIPYMAPECMLGQKYNHKVDVFGFGMLLWEIFALKVPFKGFNRFDFIEKVCKGPKMRPDTKFKCPALTKGIIKECWDDDVKKRPEFSRIATILRGEMNDMAEENHSSIRNRTRHLLDRSFASMHAREH